MPAEQALRRIINDLNNDLGIGVLLSARLQQEQETVERLNISPDLQQEFQGIIRNSVSADVRLVPYDAGYKPESNEVCWIELDHSPDLTAVLDRLTAVQRPPLFREEAEFIRHLNFYAVVGRVNARRNLVFCRKATASLELGQGRIFGAIFRRGTYDTVDDRVLVFDRNIDCFSDGEYLFINNVGNFERIFRYYERLVARAGETVDRILERIPIANAEAFREACTTQTRFMAKLAMIAAKPYLANIGIADLRCAIDEHHLPVTFVQEDGVQRLRFDPDPARRWIILKLLDDDYLNSVMTHEHYEVNSKIRLGA